MTSCFAWLLLLAFAIFWMVSLIRWFEQMTEAVDYGWWNKVVLLLLFPFAVWFYPSRISAGRPTAVPHHEPVRGFGTVPLMAGDAPKPNPTMPPRKKKSPIDPEMVAKLKQKMKDQGMLEDQD